MTKSALAVWDFTLSLKKSTGDHTAIIAQLEQIAKKWAFQKEDSSIQVHDNYSDSEDSDNDSNEANVNWSDDEEFDNDLSDITSESESEWEDEMTLDDEEDHHVQWSG